jgi:hypothetical protein
MPALALLSPSSQGQANKWIRAMEAARKVVVLKPSTDPNYLRTLQVGVLVTQLVQQSDNLA